MECEQTSWMLAWRKTSLLYWLIYKPDLFSGWRYYFCFPGYLLHNILEETFNLLLGGTESGETNREALGSAPCLWSQRGRSGNRRILSLKLAWIYIARLVFRTNKTKAMANGHPAQGRGGEQNFTVPRNVLRMPTHHVPQLWVTGRKQVFQEVKGYWTMFPKMYFEKVTYRIQNKSIDELAWACHPVKTHSCSHPHQNWTEKHPFNWKKIKY